MQNSPTCILVFRLAGNDSDTSTSQLVFGHLKSYFQDSRLSNIAIIEIEINWSTLAKKRQFLKAVKGLPQELKK